MIEGRGGVHVEDIEANSALAVDVGVVAVWGGRNKWQR